MSTTEVNELKDQFQEVLFEIRELRRDMKYRFDEQDTIHNEILQSVGGRFNSNEQRITRLENHPA